MSRHQTFLEIRSVSERKSIGSGWLYRKLEDCELYLREYECIRDRSNPTASESQLQRLNRILLLIHKLYKGKREKVINIRSQALIIACKRYHKPTEIS